MRGLLICLGLLSTAALAHEGVQNPGVMARMHSMKDMSQDAKALGKMAMGAQGFDAAEVSARLEAMAEEAARIGALFEGADEDPKSEALPAIWADFAEFERRAQALEAFLRDQSGLSSAEALQPLMQELEVQCGGCHKLYRKK